MRKACPNQNTAINMIKTRGRTIAVSAISVPRVAQITLRHVRSGFFIVIASIAIAYYRAPHIFPIPKSKVLNANATP